MFLAILSERTGGSLELYQFDSLDDLPSLLSSEASVQEDDLEEAVETLTKCQEYDNASCCRKHANRLYIVEPIQYSPPEEEGAEEDAEEDE